jgi:hypothetical protein
MNNNNSNKPKSGQMVRLNPPVNRLLTRAQRIALEKVVISRAPQGRQNKKPQQRSQKFLPNRGDGRISDGAQIGAVVRLQLSKIGMSDIRRHRVTYVTGYTYVGDGTNGTANLVYFLPFSAGTPTWLVKGTVAASSSGQVPILPSDADLGATYVSDVEKHYARKVLRRLWIHVDSLHPNTGNDMMCVIAPSRGPGGAFASIPITYATAVVAANTVGNVSSMKSAFTVASYESKTLEITDYIAGGSGPKQDEFELGRTGGSANASFWTSSATLSTMIAPGLVPACFAVAGNSTTVGLKGVQVHQISIEQEVDLLDYVGGLFQAAPEA